MKPIIVDMKDMSESTEVYESRANPFLVYTIYSILLILAAAVIWMYFSKMEIVVKSSGMFRCDEPIYEVSAGISGKVENCNIKDGQLVKEGEVLFTVEAEQLVESTKSYQKELEDINQRIEMLKAYDESLEGDDGLPDALSENRYYQEFAERRRLLLANIDASGQNSQGQKDTYQGNIDTISGLIQQYKTKKEKLIQAKSCIVSRTNTFGKNDSYYSSIVSSYISNYNLTASQYDIQISDYQKQIDTYGNEAGTAAEKQEDAGAVIDITAERDAAVLKLEELKGEKNQVLSNLELQQISGIEQQIESINDTILSLNSNLTSAQLQMQSVKEADTSNIKEIQILTEKGNIASELLTYQGKAEACQNYLKNYDIQNHNCNITANISGYLYLEQDLKQGSYVQEGMSIGKIYPQETTDYYADIYVGNADIGNLKEGQEIKFEISAYPSEEYGYFTGTINHISKDIKVDEGSGSAFYLVKAACDNVTVKNKNGKTGAIMNGMACQAKVIVDEESVLSYLLKKMDIM